MKPPPVPENEAQRLAELAEYEILDTPQEKVFNDFTELASHICGTPISLISLVAESRQWFKARKGLEAQETDRNLAFCAHAIMNPDVPMVVQDTYLDERFHDHPAVVNDPKVRFYAGAPLVTPSGNALGTLCVVDSRPRNLTPQQVDALSILSRQVVQLMEIRRMAKELKKSREEVRKSRDEALAANRMKTQFLANVSHEIRTPMNGIIGITQLLEETDLKGAQVDYVQAIKGSSEALLGIINDILDIARVEAGRFALTEAPFNLRDVIEDVAEFMAFQAHGKGLDLNAVIPGNMPPILMGDAGRIRQIILNLVGNAIKFTEKGEVLIETEIVARRGGHVWIEIRVSDTGVGIPPDYQERIFEGFVQVEGEAEKVRGGTGLGLTISKRLAEMMGGTITLDSVPGRGSTFTTSMKLPVAKDALNDSSTRLTKPLLISNGKKVYLADPKRTSRESLHRDLTDLGLDVVEAKSCEQLASLLDQGQMPDLIMIDVTLCQNQFKELKKRVESTRIPIIYLARLGLDRPKEATWGGSTQTLLKPVRRESLSRALAQVFKTIMPEGEAQREAALKSPLTGLSILVAEDNMVNRMVAQRLLEALGARVTTAANGAEAVAATAACSYDVVLMDCQMPILDGYAATAQIREREKELGTHLPIIALTAHAMGGEKERCQEAGMDDYLSKPIRRESLVAQILLHTGTANRIMPR